MRALLLWSPESGLGYGATPHYDHVGNLPYVPDRIKSCYHSRGYRLLNWAKDHAALGNWGPRNGVHELRPALVPIVWASRRALRMPCCDFPVPCEHRGSASKEELPHLPSVQPS